MSNNVVIRTILPIFLLIAMGFLSKKLGLLRSGDERVLSAYVYYFALPSFFFVNMVGIDFTEEGTLKFIFAGMIPILTVLLMYLILYFTLNFSRETFFLLVLSTIFGSLAFFGIPFITFTFPTSQGERLAALSAASIAILSVTVSITVLELYRLNQPSVWKGLSRVARKLSKNPLVLSIFFGIMLSLVRVEIPLSISTFLHMLGRTTSTVAIFMLGVFLYGRKYKNLV